MAVAADHANVHGMAIDIEPYVTVHQGVCVCGGGVLWGRRACMPWHSFPLDVERLSTMPWLDEQNYHI